MVENNYTGTILRIDLGSKQLTKEIVEEEVMRKYVGGSGLGAKYLYENVPPGIKWNDPENIVFFGAGPLGGDDRWHRGFLGSNQGPANQRSCFNSS